MESDLHDKELEDMSIDITKGNIGHDRNSQNFANNIITYMIVK